MRIIVTKEQIEKVAFNAELLAWFEETHGEVWEVDWTPEAQKEFIISPHGRKSFGYMVNQNVLPCWNMGGWDFTGLDLSGANFSWLNFRMASFANSDLTKAVFFNCNLQMVHFDNAIMEETCFSFCKLSEAGFDGCKLTGSHIGSNFSNAYLGKADVTDAYFRGCEFNKIPQSGMALNRYRQVLDSGKAVDMDAEQGETDGRPNPVSERHFVS